MARRARHLAVVTAAAAVMAIAGCGDDSSTSASTTTTSSASTTTSSGASSTTAGATTTSSASTTTSRASTTTAGATIIEVGYAGGTITGGGKRSVPLGRSVVIRVTSDTADEVHVHGYDEKADTAPGTVATITFVADMPGIYEVELEKKGLRLFELEVK